MKDWHDGVGTGIDTILHKILWFQFFGGWGVVGRGIDTILSFAHYLCSCFFNAFLVLMALYFTDLSAAEQLERCIICSMTRYQL